MRGFNVQAKLLAPSGSREEGQVEEKPREPLVQNTVSSKSCSPCFYCAFRPRGQSNVTLTLSVVDSVTAIYELCQLSPACQKSRTAASRAWGLGITLGGSGEKVAQEWGVGERHGRAHTHKLVLSSMCNCAKLNPFSIINWHTRRQRLWSRTGMIGHHVLAFSSSSFFLRRQDSWTGCWTGFWNSLESSQLQWWRECGERFEPEVALTEVLFSVGLLVTEARFSTVCYESFPFFASPYCHQGAGRRDTRTLRAVWSSVSLSGPLPTASTEVGR